MHKPLELPLRVRFWHFVRGLLFYNTVYWKRASDDVNPPRISRRERQAYQPARNMEIIRPRERPRARLLAARGAEVSEPSDVIEPAAAAPPVPVPPPVAIVNPPPAMPVAETTAPAERQEGEEVIVKRRRYRRRRPSTHS